MGAKISHEYNGSPRKNWVQSPTTRRRRKVLTRTASAPTLVDSAEYMNSQNETFKRKMSVRSSYGNMTQTPQPTRTKFSLTRSSSYVYLSSGNLQDDVSYSSEPLRENRKISSVSNASSGTGTSVVGRFRRSNTSEMIKLRSERSSEKTRNETSIKNTTIVIHERRPCLSSNNEVANHREDQNLTGTVLNSINSPDATNVVRVQNMGRRKTSVTISNRVENRRILDKQSPFDHSARSNKIYGKPSDDFAVKSSTFKRANTVINAKQSPVLKRTNRSKLSRTKSLGESSEARSSEIEDEIVKRRLSRKAQQKEDLVTNIKCVEIGLLQSSYTITDKKPIHINLYPLFEVQEEIKTTIVHNLVVNLRHMPKDCIEKTGHLFEGDIYFTESTIRAGAQRQNRVVRAHTWAGKTNVVSLTIEELRLKGNFYQPDGKTLGFLEFHLVLNPVVEGYANMDSVESGVARGIFVFKDKGCFLLKNSSVYEWTAVVTQQSRTTTVW